MVDLINQIQQKQVYSICVPFTGFIQQKYVYVFIWITVRKKRDGADEQYKFCR
jgi:hypothetical protein